MTFTDFLPSSYSPFFDEFWFACNTAALSSLDPIINEILMNKDYCSTIMVICVTTLT